MKPKKISKKTIKKSSVWLAYTDDDGSPQQIGMTGETYLALCNHPAIKKIMAEGKTHETNRIESDPN